MAGIFQQRCFHPLATKIITRAPRMTASQLVSWRSAARRFWWMPWGTVEWLISATEVVFQYFISWRDQARSSFAQLELFCSCTIIISRVNNNTSLTLLHCLGFSTSSIKSHKYVFLHNNWHNCYDFFLKNLKCMHIYTILNF